VHYRCYLLNLHSRIDRVEMIEAETDSDAVAGGVRHEPYLAALLD
jgi:hypothetical protein